ncbi:LAMI_0G01662g1_1 [Lachancea mirantina]|uniref:LAMI_0G01662g1_1 n=1 Tax=Lachancea mirantina TaxID=1230905 RepID=A0A1G4K7K1_9SACH|nr:LAMI_0G01662g1_1 [Lachancea mirantina]
MRWRAILGVCLKTRERNWAMSSLEKFKTEVEKLITVCYSDDSFGVCSVSSTVIVNMCHIATRILRNTQQNLFQTRFLYTVGGLQQLKVSNEGFRNDLDNGAGDFMYILHRSAAGPRYGSLQARRLFACERFRNHGEETCREFASCDGAVRQFELHDMFARDQNPSQRRCETE